MLNFEFNKFGLLNSLKLCSIYTQDLILIKSKLEILF